MEIILTGEEHQVGHRGFHSQPRAQSHDALDQVAKAERDMNAVTKRLVALFVERSSQQWVVRDPEGNFWIVPSVETAWVKRQPFYPTEETELEPVPRHYLYMLKLPF